MKTIIISLFLVFWMGTVQAQVISLDEATVTYKAPKVVTTSNLTNLDFEVKENHQNEFMKNPIKFLENHFDFKSLNLKDNDFENIEVSFITSKGSLKATFDRKGELMKTSQRFRDIAIPSSVWREIYKNNVGWSMANNLYTAQGKGNRINTELYKVKLTQGKQKKYVKYVPQQIDGGRIAGF